MSGSNFVANIAKGKLAYYTTLPNANDALILVPLEASGLESDATLKDKDSLSDVLSGTTNEQTTMGRKTITSSVTVTVDDGNDRVDLDTPDQVWTSAAGNPIAKLVMCYDPDTTGGTDADIIPLSFHSFDATPDGNNITATIANFARAQD